MAELVHEYSQTLRDSDVSEYAVQAWGEPRADGTWQGWLEFVSIDGSVQLTTPRETTQSNRDVLAYWATGLKPAYLEGAFMRAARASARS
jgi:hypothetical protein